MSEQTSTPKLAGQFDLSVASIIALSGVAMATAAEGHPMPLAIVVAFAVGILAGAVNGFLVTVVGVNALITTLGMLSVLRGLALVIADGLSVSVEDFSTLGTARPLGVPLPVVIFLAVVVVFSFVGRFTTFGRSVYAIGSNPTAARLAGIRTRRTICLLFLLSGLACARRRCLARHRRRQKRGSSCPSSPPSSSGARPCRAVRERRSER